MNTFKIQANVNPVKYRSKGKQYLGYDSINRLIDQPNFEIKKLIKDYEIVAYLYPDFFETNEKYINGWLFYCLYRILGIMNFGDIKKSSFLESKTIISEKYKSKIPHFLYILLKKYKGNDFCRTLIRSIFDYIDMYNQSQNRNLTNHQINIFFVDLFVSEISDFLSHSVKKK